MFSLKRKSCREPSAQRTETSGKRSARARQRSAFCSMSLTRTPVSQRSSASASPSRPPPIIITFLACFFRSPNSSTVRERVAAGAVRYTSSPARIANEPSGMIASSPRRTAHTSTRWRRTRGSSISFFPQSLLFASTSNATISARDLANDSRRRNAGSCSWRKISRAA